MLSPLGFHGIAPSWFLLHSGFCFAVSGYKLLLFCLPFKSWCSSKFSLSLSFQSTHSPWAVLSSPKASLNTVKNTLAVPECKSLSQNILLTSSRVPQVSIYVVFSVILHSKCQILIISFMSFTLNFLLFRPLLCYLMIGPISHPAAQTKILGITDHFLSLTWVLVS